MKRVSVQMEPYNRPSAPIQKKMNTRQEKERLGKIANNEQRIGNSTGHYFKLLSQHTKNITKINDDDCFYYFQK